jgi:uncharacterized OB-fold protein
VVELPNTNACRLIGAMVDTRLSDMRIGMDVELAWRDVDDGMAVPTWRPSR